MSEHSAEIDAPCPAALLVAGEAFQCDWPTDEAGQHRGWAHTNKAAEAIWCGDEGPSDTRVIPPGEGKS